MREAGLIWFFGMCVINPIHQKHTSPFCAHKFQTATPLGLGHSLIATAAQSAACRPRAAGLGSSGAREVWRSSASRHNPCWTSRTMLDQVLRDRICVSTLLVQQHAPIVS